MAEDSCHSCYDSCIDSWEQVRDCISGSRRIKEQGDKYLPRLYKQSQTDYDAYVKRAVFFNALKRTLQAFVGLIFRKNPQVEVPPEMAAFMRDATMTGKSFYDVSKLIVREVLSVGKGGTVIDWQARPENRPFVIIYKAEDILNWRYRRIQGRTVLAFIVFREWSMEYIPDPDTPKAPVPNEYDSNEYEQLREYEIFDDDAGAPYLQVTVKRRKGSQEKPGSTKKVPEPSTAWRTINVYNPTRGPFPLTRIPFVPHGPEVNDLDVTEVPLEAIADINISHYQSSADLENALHMCGVPTPIFAGFDFDKQTEAYLGTSKGIVSDKAEAKAYFLSYDGTQAEPLVKALERKEAQMAALGARMLEKQGSTGGGGSPEAFQTVLARQSGDHSALMSATIACTQSLSDVLQWVAWWIQRGTLQPEDLDDKVKTELNTEYVETIMDSPMLTALFGVYMGGGISYAEFFQRLQAGGIISSERKMEEEIKDIQDDPVKMALLEQQAKADAEAQAAVKPKEGEAGTGAA